MNNEKNLARAFDINQKSNNYEKLFMKTLFLQNLGFYEFTFWRDGPYFFKGKCPLSLMNGPLSFLWGSKLKVIFTSEV